jgi:hypothetical protein
MPEIRFRFVDPDQADFSILALINIPKTRFFKPTGKKQQKFMDQ